MSKKKDRDSFIQKYCEIRKAPWEWDESKEWVQIYMDGCYLTASCEYETIISNPSVIDLLISAQINKVESIYSTEVACVGFSEKNQKWVGWSHRGACSFGIGSEVKKGDVAYMPMRKEDFEEDMLRFWSDPDHLQICIGNRTEKSFEVRWLYSHSIPNEKMRGKVGVQECYYPPKYGKGEWKAETLEDAHQMAIDYATNIG